MAGGPLPQQVAGANGSTALAAGEEYTQVLHADGTVRGWGRNESGQLGDGAAPLVLLPAVVLFP
jgi:hypothetical protein